MNRDVLIFSAGWALVHSLWQCLLIALGLRLALAVARQGAAALRYWLCCAALALMLASAASTAWITASRAPAAMRAAAAEREARAAANVLPGRPATEPLAQASPLRALRPTVVALRGARAAWADASRGIERWFPALVTLWALGVVLCSARLWGGWVLVRRLVRAGVAQPPAALVAAVERLRRRIGILRPVRLLSSTRVHVPMVVGWLRPVILLPVSALTGLTPRQLELLILHELAHVRRHDHLVAVLQAVAEAVLFHHPAAWWVSARIREEREHCCDDVVACMEGVRDYVDALATMEAVRARPSAFALAADGAPLFRRVIRLMETRQPRPSVGPRLVAGGGLLAIAVVLALPDGGRASAGDGDRPVAAPLRAASTSTPPPSACAPASPASTLCPALVDAAERVLSARAAGGVVLVQDVRTGAVLVHSAAGAALTEPAAPGSVWKLVLAALWWDQGLPEDAVRCTRTVELPHETIRAAYAARGQRGVHEMLVVSCNTSAVRMALALRDRLGEDGLARELERMGFPVAAAGPGDQAARDEAFWASSSAPFRARMSPRRPGVGVAGDDPSSWAGLALGMRRVQVTPLHISRFLQAVGNGGLMLAPTVEPAVAAAPAPPRRVIGAETAARLQAAMRDVVRRGTAQEVGRAFAGGGWRLGGKTGTVPHQGHREDGWFVGLAFDPAGAARYSVLVYLPESGSGSGDAAHLAARLAARLASPD